MISNARVSLFVTLALTLAGAQAQARGGVDESIHNCVTGEHAPQLGGPGVQYEAHQIVGKSLKLTRISDKKSIEGTYDSAWSIYRFNSGDLLPPEKAYTSGVRDGRMNVSYVIERGVHGGNQLTCTLARQISKPNPLTATEKKLVTIAEMADLANGEYEILDYKPESLDLAKEKKALSKLKAGWEGCTWTETEGDAAIMTVKKSASDVKVYNRIMKLTEKPGIKAVLGLNSDSGVSCSQTYVVVYTNDGYALKLLYSQGD